MLKIGFVITPGFPIMSLAALSVFEFANLEAEQSLYSVVVLSEDGGPVATSMGTMLESSAFGGEYFDTLIIGGHTRIQPTSAALRAYIEKTSRVTRRMSSICTGVFALADAGLVEDRRVTTHWAFTEPLKARFPRVRVLENRLFVIDGSFWTAAGNSAGIDLTLRMLEDDYGATIAQAVARTLVVDYRRSGGQPQHSALLAMSPKSDRIQNALAFARRNLRGILSVESLAEVAGLGPRQFNRAFRTETGLSPAKGIENLRIEAARLMLEQSLHPVGVIAAETGFGDQERMRRAFMRALGRPPSAIRRTAQAIAAQT